MPGRDLNSRFPVKTAVAITRRRTPRFAGTSCDATGGKRLVASEIQPTGYMLTVVVAALEPHTPRRTPARDGERFGAVV
jgi:hypothetical protein